jgi:hypothetical protein
MKHTLAIFITLLFVPLAALHAAEGLLRTKMWTENWPNASGAMETRTVTAEVWTQAMQAALDADGKLHIPAREKPYYLDGPLILKSGQKITAGPNPMSGFISLRAQISRRFPSRPRVELPSHPSSFRIQPSFAPRSPQTPSLPDARPRSDRPRCDGRESNFLAACRTSKSNDPQRSRNFPHFRLSFRTRDPVIRIFRPRFHGSGTFPRFWAGAERVRGRFTLARASRRDGRAA